MWNIIAVTPVVEQKQITIAFHIARNPEFLQGIQAGYDMFSQELDVSGEQGQWNVADPLRFVQAERTPESLTKAHKAYASEDIFTSTPIYNLGIIAGFLSMLAEKASQSKEAVCPACKTFTPSHPTFLSGIQQGAEIYQQEHLSDIALTYLAMLAFYQRNLTPFQFDPPGHTGILLGWVRAFLASGHAPEFYSESTDFLVSYHLASQDWRAWPKDELLTDIGFAAGLENEISPQTLATMQRAEPWYTRAYQIGYAFGLARDLLSSPDIQMIEHQAYPQAA